MAEQQILLWQGSKALQWQSRVVLVRIPTSTPETPLSYKERQYVMLNPYRDLDVVVLSAEDGLRGVCLLPLPRDATYR